MFVKVKFEAEYKKIPFTTKIKTSIAVVVNNFLL